MNTQAHLLLAAALLCRSSSSTTFSNTHHAVAQQTAWPVNTAVLVGALIPDASLFLMFVQARIRGISHEVIWSELYYSAFWQNIGAITNSIPLYIGVALVGLAVRQRFYSMGTGLLLLALAALLHCALDFPLHVDDGHAHFWPFTDWIYSSPVSYWDSNHYSLYWQPVEFLIVCVCALAIWKMFTSFWVRLVAVIGLLSYPVMLMFWFSVTN